MITPAYSPTATERVLPRLALDFTTGALDPRVTVTRALNTATRVNSSGFIETVNADLPRFDYDPLTLTPKGLLIEESRINLASYSEDFRNTADAGATRPNTYLNMTLTQNATTSPYGVTNKSSKLVETNATGQHGCYRSGIITASGTYAYTVRIKPGERFKVQLSFGSTGNTTRFTLQGAGSVDYQLSATGFIRASADGWYYCTMVASPGSATTVSIIIMDDAGSISYTGDSTKGLYVDCIQVEAGAFATSYIPNLATGTTTRNADVVSMTGTNFSSWYNASEGALSVKYLKATTNTAGRYIVRLFSPTVGAGVSVWSNTNGIDTRYWIGATNATIGNGSLSAPNVAALAYKTAASTGALNGAANASNAGTVPSDINELRIGDGGFMNGHMQRILYWPFALTAAEIRANSKG